MPRPQKHTVDYFSHDSDASQGRTLTILFNTFGHEGISCWWQLLERVCSTRNHIISLRNGEDTEYLAAKLHFTPERLIDILSKFAELGAIDLCLFQQGLIWSQNLVDRLEPVYKTRKQDLPTKPKLISKETELISKETELILPVSTQTKETKETKLKKEREGNISFEDFIEQELKADFQDLNIEQELKQFHLYWSEGNRKLQRPKTAFRNWLLKAREFKKNGTHQINNRSSSVRTIPKPNEYPDPRDM